MTFFAQNLSVMYGLRFLVAVSFQWKENLRVLRKHSENRIFQVFTFLPSSFTFVLPHFSQQCFGFFLLSSVT